MLFELFLENLSKNTFVIQIVIRIVKQINIWRSFPEIGLADDPMLNENWIDTHEILMDKLSRYPEFVDEFSSWCQKGFTKP